MNHFNTMVSCQIKSGQIFLKIIISNHCFIFFFQSLVKILVKSDEEEMMFTVDKNGFLELSTLRDFFSNVDNLTYKNHENISEVVPKREDTFVIPPGIREFNIRCNQSMFTLLLMSHYHSLTFFSYLL